MNVSDSTVSFHLSRIYKKLSVRNASEAIAKVAGQSRTVESGMDVVAHAYVISLLIDRIRRLERKVFHNTKVPQ